MPEVGRKAPEATHTQSVCFYKDAGWTESSSKDWCAEHDYYTDGMDETDSLFRWRQYDPDDGKFRYRNQEIEKDSIFLVVGYLKDGQEDKIQMNIDGEGNRGLKHRVPESTEKRKPLRCFEGNAQPYEPFWRMVDAAESESGQAELELYGFLSEYSWFEDDITPAKFKADLYEKGKGGPVLMKINSPGGDVIAASVMRAILKDYPGEVTARVDGLAASAAVLVTISAKKVLMLDSAYMMIHDPAVVVFLAMLDIETLGKLHDQLSDIKDGLVQSYMSKTGMGKTELAHLMTDETWMSARQAVDYGFADEVLEGGQAGRSGVSPLQNTAVVNCLRSYAHVPQAVMEGFIRNIQETEVSSEPMLTDDMRREAQNLRDRVQSVLRKENPNA